MGSVVIIGKHSGQLYLWKITQAFQMGYNEVEVKVCVKYLSKANEICDMLKKAYDIKEIEERTIKNEPTSDKVLESVSIKLCKKLY